LVAEIGDIGAFSHPKQLASYLGVVPSEHSSGMKRRQGSITAAGSSHARRLLVEAAWHYRRQPSLSLALKRRQKGQPPAAIDAAWRAQLRLHRRWSHLDGARQETHHGCRRSRTRARLLRLGDRQPTGLSSSHIPFGVGVAVGAA
jgi:transposase